MTTNFSDVGSNYQRIDNSTQVPVLYGKDKDYRFAPFNQEAIRYDEFWERENLEKALEIPEGTLSVDLYGYRNDIGSKKYLLTLEHKNYKIVKQFALRYRPHEINIVETRKEMKYFFTI